MMIMRNKFIDMGNYDIFLNTRDNTRKFTIRENFFMRKKYVKNGKYVEYINNNLSAKTIGQFKNDKPDGKFIHYHHNKVYYIDIYSPDDTYIRTFYSDYDNNIVKSVETGRLNKFGLYEKDININTDQLKTLKLN